MLIYPINQRCLDYFFSIFTPITIFERCHFLLAVKRCLCHIGISMFFSCQEPDSCS